jgi:hypothetical protein
MKEQSTKPKALCDVCHNPIKKSQAIIIKNQDIPDCYKKHLPYTKYRHQHCFTCIICKEPVSERNIKFIGSPEFGLGYCQDSCHPGSPLWLDSDIGKASKQRRCFENMGKEEEVEPSKITQPVKKKKKKVVPLTHKNPEVEFLLKQLVKCKDPQKARKIRRKLRKLGAFISNLKNPDRNKNRKFAKKKEKIK